ncbi:SRPBCC domain-containing protein [Thalassococcus sp. S3]|uniref:SRPBCC domain-containing protein n=1 Tax=Thalassococcus sp. S3 TaxID=2017482 RepID=UPI0010245227|nr:ATPase [Thalassococcus sp. S3]
MSSRRVDRAQRTISAPAELIYGAFLEPSLPETWLPPNGMTGKVREINASDGGGHVMSLYHRDVTPAVPGQTTEHKDRFQVMFDELKPGMQVVQRVMYDAAAPSFAGAMRQTWTFQSSEQGTTVSVAREKVPTGIRPKDHAAGLNSSLLKLARMVETNTRPAP